MLGGSRCRASLGQRCIQKIWLGRQNEIFQKLGASSISINFQMQPCRARACLMVKGVGLA